MHFVLPLKHDPKAILLMYGFIPCNRTLITEKSPCASAKLADMRLHSNICLGAYSLQRSMTIPESSIIHVEILREIFDDFYLITSLKLLILSSVVKGRQ